MQVKLVALDNELADAWQKEFANEPDVKVIVGDILEQEADVLVSPANSFGLMDGGLDLAIRDYFKEGFNIDIEAKVRQHITQVYGGEMLVGQADLIHTGHPSKFAWLAIVPTMRTPRIVANTENTFLSTKALFSWIVRHNSVTYDVCPNPPKITSVAVPGMGTGVGRVPSAIAARQMFMAYKESVYGLKYARGTWRDIDNLNRLLFGLSPIKE